MVWGSSDLPIPLGSLVGQFVNIPVVSPSVPVRPCLRPCPVTNFQYQNGLTTVWDCVRLVASYCSHSEEFDLAVMTTVWGASTKQDKLAYLLHAEEGAKRRTPRSWSRESCFGFGCVPRGFVMRVGADLLGQNLC